MKQQSNFEECNRAVIDGYGVTYSTDGRRLVHGNCDLCEYTVRDGVEVICDGAFLDGFLQRITLPESLKVIGREAFAHCDKLEEVVLPAGVEDIRDGAFYGCDSLKCVVLPMTAKRISETAFPENSNIVML